MGHKEVKDTGAGRIRLDSLYVRYIPVVTPIDLWRHDMHLANSPHVELMKIFKRHGLNWSKIEKSRYYEERVRRHEIGMSRWDINKVRSHIKDRYGTFKSIKKNGIISRYLAADPVRVLPTPFWGSRFGFVAEWYKGYEIWNGAGRCAAAFALGHKYIKVMWCKDRFAGTGMKGKFEDKLKNVKGVWDDSEEDA